MPRTHVSAAVAALVAAVALAGCTGTPAATPSVPQLSPPPASGDGVLRIGTLLPTSGPAAYISPAQVAGVELAVRDINEAGGAFGVPVEVLHRNSGEAETQTAESSFADLAARGVDVVIGPASSVLAERLLPLAVAHPVLLISPSAASPVLTGLDDDGLLARTVPSSTMQGEALAEALAKDGVETVALVSLDDATADAMSAAVEAALDRRDLELVADERFTADGDLAAAVSAAAKSDADAVVLSSTFAAMQQNTAVMAALAEAKLGGERLWLTSAALADYSHAMPAGTLVGVRGVLEGRAPDDAFSARVHSMDPALADIRYAAEAYDATVLAALAAVAAKDDAAASVAFRLREVSHGGIKCLTFGECLDVLATQPDIDYDGVSGPIALDAAGDPTIAHYGVYAYDAANRFDRVGDVLGER